MWHEIYMALQKCLNNCQKQRFGCSKILNYPTPNGIQWPGGGVEELKINVFIAAFVATAVAHSYTETGAFIWKVLTSSDIDWL
jgi:hypothetical protein